MTSWHEDGLDNHLIREGKKNPEDGEAWVVVDLPALIEEEFPASCPEDKRKVGEALWEGRFPAKRLNIIKSKVGSRNWASIWQQKANVQGGTIIKRHWFKYWAKMPPVDWFDRILLSWDLAFKKKEDSSFVVGQVWGLKGSGRYLLDQTRDRMSFTQSLHAFEAMVMKWPTAVAKLVEDKANGPALMDVLEGKISGIIPWPADQDKVARLEACAPAHEAGNVYLPSPEVCPWVTEYIEELCTIPAAMNDDQGDASSQAHAYIQSNSPELFDSLSQW